jgi:hypothetical protein
MRGDRGGGRGDWEEKGRGTRPSTQKPFCKDDNLNILKNSLDPVNKSRSKETLNRIKSEMRTKNNGNFLY